MKKTSSFKDKASATLVTGILSMLFLCLCMGLAIDLTKNSYLKGSLQTMGQQAAEKAIKSVDSRGVLNEDAAVQLVAEYNSQKYSTYSVGGGPEKDRQDETAAFQVHCTTREVNTWNGGRAESVLPYIIIRYDTDRSRAQGLNDVVLVSQGGATPTIVSGSFDPNVQYRVINAEIQDASDNFMLGMFGMPCQDYTSKVSAITFGSNEDL